MNPIKDSYFLPYQKRWIKDTSMKKIAEKSRRVGLTHAQAYEDVMDCLENRVPKVWFSSADESAAKEYIEDAARFARMVQAGAQIMGEEILDEAKGVKALRIDFENGTKIHALTSNPKAFRSKGGKVVLDEFAFHEDPQALFKAAKPAITWGWPIRIISTHNGTNSYYNEAFVKRVKEGELKNWSLHKIDIEKAVAEGLLDKIYRRPTTEAERRLWIDSQKEDMTEEDFLEEFMCIPQSEKAAFLTYQMLAEVENDNVLWGDADLPVNASGLLYLGKDVARKGHLSVKWLLEKIGPMTFTRKVIVEQNMKFRHQRDTLYEILQHPMLRRACIDSTGIGMQLAEEAQDRFGEYRVEMINFSAQSKEKLAYGLRNQIDQKLIVIPSDPAIRKDLHSVKKIITSHGNVRFDQDSLGAKNTDGHGDRFWAAALAVEASKSYSGEIKVASAGRREADRMMENF